MLRRTVTEIDYLERRISVLVHPIKSILTVIPPQWNASLSELRQKTMIF